MGKRIGLASDFILLGYVLQGLTAVMNWPMVLTCISLGFALIALGFSCVGTSHAIKATEGKSKKLKKSIYYIVLSLILIVICAYKVVNQ